MICLRVSRKTSWKTPCLNLARQTSCRAESPGVTDWVHNGSLENSIKSQPNVADANPSACASIHETPMSTSFLVNPEGVNIRNANLDNITQGPTHLFQQQLCATGIKLSIPAVTSGLDTTAIAPPPFDVSLVNSTKFLENCSSNPLEAVPLLVLPTLQPITTVTTVAPEWFIAPITSNLSSCTNPLPGIPEQPIATFHAFTILDVATGKIVETSNPVAHVESRGNVFYCIPSAQTAPQSSRTMTNSLQENPLGINAPPFVPTMGPAAPVTPASPTVQVLAQLLAASKKTIFQSGNGLNTTATLLKGMSGSVSLKVP